MSTTRLFHQSCCLLSPASDRESGGQDKRGGYTPEEQRFLINLARETVRNVVMNGGLPDVQKESLSQSLQTKKGCFVTLRKRGELRGCIGHILPREPLYRAVMENARSAAIHDYRFSPVNESELGDLHIEISVLTEPKPLQFENPAELLRLLEPYRDGVVMHLGHARTATFLPQVWEQLPEKESFLNHLASKAGGKASDWRHPGVKIEVYQVEAFEEQ